MTDAERFTLVGTRELPPREAPKRHRLDGFPWVSLAVLAVIVLGCLACDLLMTHDPTYLDLAHCSEAPNGTFFFGTDALGRDLFSGIWYGGRISLTIGVLATLLSTAVATVYGTVSGLAPQWLDTLLMRLTELSQRAILLLIVFLQAILGQANAVSISVTIGLTSWAGIAQDRPHRGASAPAQRVRPGRPRHGRRVLPRAGAAPVPQLLLRHPLHGGHEPAGGHRGGIHLELFGAGSAAGGHLLGEYAVPGGKGPSVRRLVGHPPPRRIPHRRPALCDQSGQLSAQAGHTEGEQPIT